MALYNGLGQLVQTTAEGESGPISVDYQYDGLGRQWKVSAPYTGTAQLWTETAYDALGRTAVITHTDSTSRQTIYTGRERVEVRDENGHYKGYSLDALGRTVQVDEYRDGYPSTPYAAPHYSYDLLGNLTGVEDGLGHTTVITYDSLGRKLAMDDPDMGTWSYTYDADGNLATQTDAGGTVITFTYDPLDRLTGKSYSDPNTAPVTYTYDLGTNGKGRRTALADASGTAAYTYDQQGRLLTETRTVDGVAYTTGFTYDPLDRVRTLTYPDGEVITYDYNDQGLLESMGTSLGGNYVQNMAYNALGQTTFLQLGNGLATTYGYHEANFRLESIVTTGGLQDLSYTYDDVGNVQILTDTVGGLNLSYTYDELDRLTGVSGSYGRTYSYNPIGNLTDKNGLTLEYNDPRPHAVSRASDGGTATDYDYGPTGNLITRTVGSQVVTFGYDAENRLTEVISDAVGSAITTTLVYDGDGRRVKKVDESGTTVYVGEHYEIRYSEGEQQWGTDIKVNDSGIEGSGPAIAVDGSGNAYVVWTLQIGWLDGGYVYADKLPAGSETWGTDTEVNDIPPLDTFRGPDNSNIAVDAEGNACAVWDDDRLYRLGPDIFSSELAAGESEWGDNLTVNHAPGTSMSQLYPAVAMDADGNAYAVWADYFGIQFAMLPVGSSTWMSHTVLSDGAPVPGGEYETLYPAIAVDTTGGIHVVWKDRHNDNYGDIYYDHSTDGGASWNTDEKVNDDQSGLAQHYPDIAVDGSGNVHVVWQDERSGSDEIYYARRGPSGWEANIRVESATTESGSSRPAIAVDGAGTVYVVWDHREIIPYKNDIYFASLAAGSSQWSAKTRVNDDTGYVQQIRPDIAVDGGGNVYVVWHDQRNGANDIYFDRLVSGSSEVTKHYYANGQRIATRMDGSLYYVHQDHPSTGSGQAWAAPWPSATRAGSRWAACNTTLMGRSSPTPCP